jgi:peptidoglycan/xylan/chitin deacetylase (PgdA/CDA1 family)
MKLAFSALAGRGRSTRLSTLIFHRVTPKPDELFPGEVDAQRFNEICGWVGRWFNVIPLSDAVIRIREGTLPPRPLCITFDDGYADNHDVALPILQRHGLTATFFVATGYLDGGVMWNDILSETMRSASGDLLDLRSLNLSTDGIGCLDLSSPGARRTSLRRLLLSLKYLAPSQRSSLVNRIASVAGVALPVDLMLGTDQVRSLHQAGMDIGAHTVSHPILARVDEVQARSEIMDSKRCLEAIIDAPVSLFAYPNGKLGEDYLPRDVSLVRDAGFAAAFTTEPGVSAQGSDMFQLPRYTPWREGKWSFAAQMLKNFAVR